MDLRGGKLKTPATATQSESPQNSRSNQSNRKQTESLPTSKAVEKNPGLKHQEMRIFSGNKKPVEKNPVPPTAECILVSDSDNEDHKFEQNSGKSKRCIRNEQSIQKVKKVKYIESDSSED